jgi:glucose-1-phosphate thymidylyltransferase
MKIIIPVAGAGTRLQPHTLTIPKPLLEIANKPVLDYVLEPLLELKPDEIIFVIGHKGQMIIDYVRKRYSVKTSFVPQSKLLGLGFAVHLALEKITNEPTMIVLGDTIVECDFAKVIDNGDYVLGVREVDDPHRFGIAEINDGIVAGLEEKPENPKSNLALIGLYYFKESVSLKESLIRLINSGKTTNGEIQLTDALQSMISNGTKFVSHNVQGWYDCGKKETMLTTNNHILDKQTQSVKIEGSKIIHPVLICPSTKITNSTLGPYVSVGSGTEIRGSKISNSIIGHKAIIKDSELKDSLVGNSSKIDGVSKVLNVGEKTEITTP